MGLNRLTCGKCGGPIYECYTRTGGRVSWKVEICLNCGWMQKRRSSKKEISEYSKHTNHFR